MSEPAAFRILRPDDARTLAMIHADVFTSPWSAAALRSELAKPSVLGLGLLDDAAPDQVAAFVLFQRALDEAEVLTIATGQAFQRMGYGRALLKAGFAHLAERGVGRIFLEVAHDNLAATSLYETFGFSRDGIRKAYYTSADHPPKDAILMSRVMTGLPKP